LRLRTRCLGVAALVALTALAPALPAALAATLADNVPLLDDLGGGNTQDDHSFNVTTGTWAAVGTLVYEQAGNSGDLRAELRQSSTAGAMLAYDGIGNFDEGKALSVLTVDG
jgi:hypothetical protein